jgi:hypothetical protein
MDSAVELYLAIDLNRFLELLQVYSLAKGSGPFSWTAPYGSEGVRVLFLDKTKRLGKNSVECKIDELCYRKPGTIIISGRKHVITLYATQVSERRLHLLAKCQEPQAYETSFKYFVAHVAKLEGELIDHPPDQEPLPSETLPDSGHMETSSGGELPGQDSQNLEPWRTIADHGWDRQALELWWQGLTVREIAARLHLGEKTMRNRLTALRKIYGEGSVPTAAQLRRMNRR